LVSPISNGDEGLKIHQQAWIYRSNLAEGNDLTHSVHTPGQGLYLFVIAGGVEVNGQVLGRRDAVGISETDAVTIKATSNSDFILLEVPMAM
jgi:quercetin 2,3-dioxygenase